MKNLTNPTKAGVPPKPGTYAELLGSFKRSLRDAGSKSVPNKMSGAHCWLEFRNKTLDSPVEEDLGAEFENLLPGFLASLWARFKEDTSRARKSQVVKLREHWLSTGGCRVDPKQLVVELRRLHEGSGKSLKDVRRGTGLQLQKYFCGASLPTLETCEKLEHFYGVTAGTLTRHGRRLPARDCEAEVLKVGTPQTRGLTAQEYALRTVSVELDADLQALRQFKTTTALPPGVNRQGMWRTEQTPSGLVCATANKEQSTITRALGWLHHVRHWLNAKCRLGALTDAELWEGYVEFLAQRRGKTTRTVTDALSLAKALIHPVHGFLSQYVAITLGGLHVDLAETATWARFFATADDPEAECAQAAGLRQRARLRRWCELNHEQLKRGVKQREESGTVESGRKPTQRIEAILKLSNPISALVELVGEMHRITDYIGDEDRKFSHARDTLLIGLGAATCLRIKQLCMITCCGDGREDAGWLRCDENGAWMLHVPVRSYKNWRQMEARYGREKPILYEIPPDLAPIIESYLPLRAKMLTEASLASPAVGDLLLVTCRPTRQQRHARALRENYASTIFVERAHQFTPGFAPQGINPHAVRHIVATTYVSLTGDIYGAALLLQDSVEVVARTYKHITERDRQKVGGFMASAWEGRMEKWALQQAQQAANARRAF